MKAFKNYGTSHLLATLIVTTLIALIPLGFLVMVGDYIHFASTAWFLSGLCYVVMAVVGMPTELWLRAKFADPSLLRAYGVYALSGLGAAVLIGGLFMVTNQLGGASLYVVYVAVVFYVLYLPIMLFTRGLFVPIERKLREVFPLKSDSTENEVTDVLY